MGSLHQSSITGGGVYSSIKQGTLPDPSAELCTHHGIRLQRLDDRTQARWVAYHLPRHRRFALSQLGATVLTVFMGGGRRVDAAVSIVCESTTYPAPAVVDAINKLSAAGLLVIPSDASSTASRELFQDWSRYGWSEAADHHLATFDFPFVDYGERGSQEDIERMRAFRAADADDDRTKTYACADYRLPLPTARDALRSLDTSFEQAIAGSPNYRRLDGQALAVVLAAVFTKLRERNPIPPDDSLPLIRKTSPSGGARHPTEAYVFVISVDGLPPGIYHVAVAKFALERIRPPVAVAELRRLMPGPFWATFDVGAVIVFSSVVGRNMYRYREPRTFRTLFMDVGHLVATLEIVSRGVGVNCLSQHGVNDVELETLLGIDPLIEPVIYAAALG